MAELVGTIASCVQLLDCCIKISSSISEVYERVKGARERLQKHTEEIGHLIDTAILIRQTKLLQNDAVDSHVCTTLSQAQNLQRTLDDVAANYRKGFFRRYWQASQGSQEKKIVACFENLEHRKTALLICINIIQSESLGHQSESLAGIEGNVSRILGVVSEKTEKRTRTRWTITASTVAQIPPFRDRKPSKDATENSDLEDQASTTPKQYSVDISKTTNTTEKRQSIITMPPPVYRSTMPQDQKLQNQNQSQNPTPRKETSQLPPSSHHIFRRMKIESKNVVYGNIYGKGKSRVGTKLIKNGSGNFYSDIETTCTGRVIIGDVYDSPGLWK